MSGGGGGLFVSGRQRHVLEVSLIRCEEHIVQFYHSTVTWMPVPRPKNGCLGNTIHLFCLYVMPGSRLPCPGAGSHGSVCHHSQHVSQDPVARYSCWCHNPKYLAQQSISLGLLGDGYPWAQVGSLSRRAACYLSHRRHKVTF